VTAPALAAPAGAAPAASLHQALLLAGRNVRHLRTPGSVIGAVVIPLVFFVGFSAVLGVLLAARGIDYAQYLTPAIVVQAGMFTAMSAGFAVSGDRHGGILTRYRSMSIGRPTVLAGRLGADAVRSLCSLLVVVLAGTVVGFRFGAGTYAALAFVGLALAFTLSLAIGAAALGVTSDSPEAVNATLQLPYLPLITLSSAFVPTDAFPDWLEPVIRYSPVTMVVDALRALAGQGSPGPAVAGALAWIAGLGLVFGWAWARATRNLT